MKLTIVGSVEPVVRGNVDDHVCAQASLNEIAFGLGAGRRGSFIGEMIIWDHKAYIYTPQKEWTEDKIVWTPFLVGIPKGKGQLYTCKEIVIEKFYQKLLQEFPKGYALVGEMTFQELEVCFLKLPPIYGESLLTMRTKYWGQETLCNQTVKLFGFVLPESDSRLFYHNPNQKHPSQLLSHTHILGPLGARHLLTESKITSGSVRVFPLDA